MNRAANKLNPRGQRPRGQRPRGPLNYRPITQARAEVLLKERLILNIDADEAEHNAALLELITGMYGLASQPAASDPVFTLGVLVEICSELIFPQMSAGQQAYWEHCLREGLAYPPARS